MCGSVRGHARLERLPDDIPATHDDDVTVRGAARLVDRFLEAVHERESQAQLPAPAGRRSAANG